MAKVGVEVIGDATSLLRALGESSTAVDRFGVSYVGTFDEMSTATLKLAVAQDKLAISTAKFGQGTAGAASAAVAYRSQIDALAASQLRAAQAVGRSLSTFVTAPVVVAGYEAIKLGTNFQSAMLQIQTQAGASAAEVKDLSQQVLAFASSGAQQGPVTLAQGLYHLESVGLRGAAAMNVLKEASKAAALGMAPLEEVATALGGVVVTGIRGAQDYAQAMGTLNAGIGAGNMRMEDLVAALGTGVVPAAHAAGISLTELMAAMAVMTDRGVPAEMAGTRLRMTLALMQHPTAAASKSLADLGVNADSLAGMLREPNGLLNVVTLLHDRIQAVGSTRGNRDLLGGFGGGRSGSGVQTLVASLDSSTSSLQGKMKQIQGTSGQLAASEAAQQQTSAAKFHMALAAMEADAVKLGGAITPTVIVITSGIAKIADAVTALPDVVKEPLGVVVGLLAVGGPLLLAGVAVKKMVGSIGDAFGALPVKAGPALGSVGGSAAAAGGEVTVLGQSLQQLGPDAVSGAGTAATALEGLSVPLAGAEAQVGALDKGFLGLGPAATAGAVEVGGAMTVIETEAGAASAQVGILSGRLAALAGMQIGVTIAIEEIIHRKAIGSVLGDVVKWTDSKLPFLANIGSGDFNAELKGGALGNTPTEQAQSIAQMAAAGNDAAKKAWATIVEANKHPAQLEKDYAHFFKSLGSEQAIVQSQGQPARSGETDKVSGGTIVWKDGHPYFEKTPTANAAFTPGSGQVGIGGQPYKLGTGATGVKEITPAEADRMMAEKKTRDLWVADMMKPLPYFSPSARGPGGGHPDARNAIQGPDGQLPGEQPLTAAQQLEINLAAHPTDTKFMADKAAADQSAINWLTRRRNEGKITDAEYVKQVKALYADKQSMVAAIATAGTKAAKDITTVPMAIQVQTAAAGTTPDTGDDKAAAAATKAFEENLISSKHLAGQSLVDALNIIAQANQTLSQFTVPIQMQVEQAKASTTESLADDLKVAAGIRSWALAQIKSGTLGPQAMIAAFGIVAQANQTLSQVTVPLGMQLAQARAAAADNTAAELQVATQIKAWALAQIASGHLSKQAQIAALGIVTQMNQTIGQFTLPWKLQLGQAEAGITLTTADDIANAAAIKAYALKAIASHKLSHAGQLAALAAIQQANQVIGVQTGKFTGVTSSSFVKGLHFASVADKREAEARFAQSQAHSGHRPTGHTVDGQTITIHNVIELDGQKVGENTISHIQRKGTHHVARSRGTNAGRGLMGDH